MKKIFSIVIITVIIFSVACRSQSHSDETIQALIEQHPEMEQEIDKLSDEFRVKIKLPTDIPFEVEGVYAFIQDKSNAPLERAEFIFDSSSDVKLNVTTYDGKTIIDDPDVKLDNGYNATWVDNPQAKLLRWSDEKNDATYEVALLFRENSGFKKEDLIQIANSMD